MTWIECPFLSVALLRRLKTGFQLLTGTKRFFINTKFPRPLTTVKPRWKVVLHDSRGGAREARARARAPGRMVTQCWAPSSCRRPVSGAASGASVAGDQHNSWQHRSRPGFRGLPLRAVRQMCEAHWAREACVAPDVRLSLRLLRDVVCVFITVVCVYYCSTYYKAVREGGGEWRTCATRDYEPRPV